MNSQTERAGFPAQNSCPSTIYIKRIDGHTPDDSFWLATDFPTEGSTKYSKSPLDVLANMLIIIENTGVQMVQVSDQAISELRRLIARKGSQKAVADELEVSQAYLSDILNGRRELSENVLEKLGFEKVVVHVRSRAVPSVTKAIKEAQEETSK